ncbi:MAG TPA: hypothetical protein VJ438_04510 [Candidatus Nanoarchaeia archaeon]|nr:hypothetical protein [Candidatus Nanoarchaeia archaeon]
MKRFNFNRLAERFPKYPEPLIKTDTDASAVYLGGDSMEISIGGIDEDANTDTSWGVPSPAEAYGICNLASEGCKDAKNPETFKKFCNGDYDACSKRVEQNAK